MPASDLRFGALSVLHSLAIWNALSSSMGASAVCISAIQVPNWRTVSYWVLSLFILHNFDVTGNFLVSGVCEKAVRVDGFVRIQFYF